MPTIEKKLLRFAEAHILKLGLALLFAVSLVVRGRLLDFYTNDMNSFLLPWVDIFRQEGIAALGEGVGNYNILYLLILYVISQTTATAEASMLAIKAVSMVFDYVMAVGVGLLVYHAAEGRSERQRYNWACLGFGVTALLPMVLLNSALWGQCDSIYSAFTVWAVYKLVREKYFGAFIFLGLAFCFKLQAIFILPLFIILYVTQKKFTLLLFGLPPLMLFLASLPAVLLGANLFVAFDIYFVDQVTDYEAIYVNYPSLAALIQDSRYEYFATGLTMLAMLVCFAMLVLLVRQKRRVYGYDVLTLSVWSLFACVLFLPSMHERYAYAGEVLVWAAFLARPGKRSLVPALVFTFSGYCAYAGFLFHFQPVPSQYLALANLAAFGYLTYTFLDDLAAHRVERKPARKRPHKVATAVPSPAPDVTRPAKRVAAPVANPETEKPAPRGAGAPVKPGAEPDVPNQKPRREAQRPEDKGDWLDLDTYVEFLPGDEKK